MQLSQFELSYIVLWLIAILLFPISLTILYRVAALYERVSELSVPRSAILGTPIPGTTALDLRSGEVQLEQHWKTGSRAFLVLSARCSSCKSILRGLSAIHIENLPKTRLSVLCVSSPGRCQAVFKTIRGAPIPFLRPNDWPDHTEIAVGGLPAILVLDEQQRIREIRSPTSAHDLMSFMTLLESEIHEGKLSADIAEYPMSLRQSVVK